MKLAFRRQRLKTRQPFATFHGVTSEKETIVVELKYDGLVGLGEVVPSALYKQSLESAESALVRMEAMLDWGPLAVEAVVRRLLTEFDDQRAAVCGVDAALHDWIGKRLSVPVFRLLGLEPPQCRTMFTIGLSEPAAIREKVREALAAGFCALKVKVGTDADEQTLAIIREVFDGPLFLDANEAWSPAVALDRLRRFARFRPTVVEQPVARPDWQALAGLSRLGVALIIADESCQRPADILRLHGYVDGVNIKLDKCGGIREALRMIGLARTLGMQVMLGCFVSSSLAIAPALALASLADYVDLDGHLLLAEDPFEGISCFAGKLELSDRPGLGVRPRTAWPQP